MDNNLVVVEPNDIYMQCDPIIRRVMLEVSMDTARVYGPIIQDYLEWVQDQDSSLSHASLLAEYLRYQQELGMARRTVNKKRAALRKFYKISAAMNYLTQEELLRIEQVPGLRVQGKKRAKWLTIEQMQNLLDAPLSRNDVHPTIILRDRAVLALLLGCGLRRSEPVEITWEQLVPYGQAWAITDMERKHHREQAYIPVSEWIYKILMKYREAIEPVKPTDNMIVSIHYTGSAGDSLTDQRVYDIVKFYADALGYDISPHDLRRSYARAYVNNGGDIYQLQLVLGHESIETTQEYVNEELDVEGAASIVRLDV